MLQGNPFQEIAAILFLAAAAGAAGLILRQPLIITFLFTGIVAGPSVFGIIASYEQIELFAHIGIALLLFIVGLRLDLNLIRTTGPVALATGLGQIVFTSIIGFFIALALDMSALSAAYVAVALTFSSTIIIVKLLSDKQELDSLHGRIAIGFLIVQDIAAILALVGLTTLGRGLTAGESALFVMIEILRQGGRPACGNGTPHALRSAPRASSAGAPPGADDPLRRQLGRLHGHGQRSPRVQQGSRRLPGRCVAGLHRLPGRDRGPPGEPARFSPAVLFHRPRGRAWTGPPWVHSSVPPSCSRSLS